MNGLERRAAAYVAKVATEKGWNAAQFSDVLGALGLLSVEECEKIAKKLGQDPDPNYVAMCPAGTHVAKGNVCRAKDGRIRCTPCNTESRRRRVASLA